VLKIKKQIKLQQQDINYTFRRSRRARHLRLAIYCDGNFVVTAPWFVNQNIINQFIISKAQWIISRLDYFKNFPVQPVIFGTRPNFAKYKTQALILVQNRINYFNLVYNFKFNKITIKNQKTRWGSCSRKGNLNFNYKIALLPSKLADYIIVHELCHLEEFNHSRNFWQLVAKTIPDCLVLRRELRTGQRMFY